MVREVTTNSWGSRIAGAFWGVLFGIALIGGAAFLVFWNEGNGLHTAQALQQTESVLVAVPSAPLDAKNNNRAIYTSGLATTEDVLTDKLFGVSQVAIQLDRQVEMYQWQEDVTTSTEKKLGGSEQEIKTYTYKQVWSADLIDSTHFKDQVGHQNPSVMPIKSKSQYAKNVTVGDFSLPVDLIKQISGATTVDLGKANMAALRVKFNKPVAQQGDGLYIGDDAEIPKVGDMRVNVTAVMPETVSVIAQQAGKMLQPYLAPVGQAVSLLEMGQVSSQQMIHNAEVQNRVITWILRIVSLVMMMIGFGLMMRPVAVLADVVPFLGSLVGVGTGFIAFVLGLCLWALLFAIAWFAVRPVLSIVFIALAVIISYLLFTYKKHRQLTK